MLSSYDEKHALFQHYLEADKAVLKAGKNFEKSPTEDYLRLYIECANERSSIRQVILENYDNRANMEIIERLSNENHLITIEKLLEYGAETKRGLAKNLNMEFLYLKSVEIMLKILPERIAEIHQAINSKNASASECALDALKGILLNLEMGPLLTSVSMLDNMFLELYRASRCTFYQMPSEKEYLPYLAMMDFEAIRLYETLKV